jgi:hypothetical protein
MVNVLARELSLQKKNKRDAFTLQPNSLPESCYLRSPDQFDYVVPLRVIYLLDVYLLHISTLDVVTTLGDRVSYRSLCRRRGSLASTLNQIKVRIPLRVTCLVDVSL